MGDDDRFHAAAGIFWGAVLGSVTWMALFWAAYRFWPDTAPTAHVDVIAPPPVPVM